MPCDTVILAQEIIVDNASYPTEKIAKNSHDFRPLGLGFANLGALLMSSAFPMTAIEGRDWAGAISAVMCGQAYLTSARIAEAVGPCPGYAVNEDSFLRCDSHAPRSVHRHRQQARSAGALRQRREGAGTMPTHVGERPASAMRKSP